MRSNSHFEQEREDLNAKPANRMGMVLDWGMGNCRCQILNFRLQAPQGGGVWNNRV